MFAGWATPKMELQELLRCFEQPRMGSSDSPWVDHAGTWHKEAGNGNWIKIMGRRVRKVPAMVHLH
jgi:hypothetical protein